MCGSKYDHLPVLFHIFIFFIDSSLVGFLKQPAHEKIGVVDSQWIVHQSIPSLGNQVIRRIQLSSLPFHNKDVTLNCSLPTGESRRWESTMGRGK